MPIGTKRRRQAARYHIHVVYKCALAFSKGMGLARYPCAVALALLPSFAVPMCCGRGYGGVLCGQSVQYAAAVFSGDGLFKEDFELLVCERYRVG